MAYENATQMWENVFEPACEAFGLTPVRADKISEAGDIPDQIFTYLHSADVVIADLTGGNPNVMYELGLRHTRDKITIQIGEHERLPFDVTTIRTIKFKRTAAGLIDVRNSLIEALRTALGGGFKPVTATRIWNEESPTALRREDVETASALSFVSDDPADIADDDGPGRIELMVEGEQAMEKISEILGEFTEHMETLGAIGTDATPKMEAADSAAAKLTIIKQFADAIEVPASEMSEIASDYITTIEQIDAMMRMVASDLIDGTTTLDDEGVTTFVASVYDLADSSTEASVSFTDMLVTVRDMRTWSRVLRPVSKSLEHSINAILQGNGMVSGWKELLQGAIPDEGEGR